MKVVSNHYVMDQDPYRDLRPFVDIENCWAWTACERAKGRPAVEQIALKFGNNEFADEAVRAN